MKDRLTKEEKRQAHLIATKTGGAIVLLAVLAALVIKCAYDAGFTGLVGGAVFALVLMRCAF